MDVLQRYYEALRPPAARSPVTSPAVVQARSAPSRSLDLAVTVAAAAVSVLILGPPLSPGWVAGLLAVVAVHQLGHATAARLIRVSTAVPPAGGGWDARSGRSPAGRRAVVALAGPIAGTAAAVGCLVAALGLPGGAVRTDLLGLAAAGFLVNTL